MTIDPYWAVLALGFSCLIGFELGKRAEAWHWRLKSDNIYGNRTANYSKGKFFYALPEDEYVEKILGLRR